MPLPSTGSISTSQVNTELSRPAQQFLKFSDPSVRLLFQRETGSVNLGSGRGKNKANIFKSVWYGNGTPNRSTGQQAGASFSFTVPALIYNVRIRAVGGGGGAAAMWGFFGRRTQGAHVGGPGGGVITTFNVEPGDVIYGAYGAAGGAGYWNGSYGVGTGAAGSATTIYWRRAINNAVTTVAICNAGPNAYLVPATYGSDAEGYTYVITDQYFTSGVGTAALYHGSGSTYVGTIGSTYQGYDGGPGYDPWGYYIAGYGNRLGTPALYAPSNLGGSYWNFLGVGQTNGWVSIEYPASL